MESIEEWFPGYYVGASQWDGWGGSIGEYLVAREFRADHTVHHLLVHCDGTPDTIRFVHEWRVSDRGTVEVVLLEPLMPGGDVGDVYEEVFIDDPPCGPHLIETNGLERDYLAGRYCATNFKAGTGHVGVDTCDWVPCDERAKMCAEETADAE